MSMRQGRHVDTYTVPLSSHDCHFRACVTLVVLEFTATFLHDLTSGPEFVIDSFNRMANYLKIIQK